MDTERLHRVWGRLPGPCFLSTVQALLQHHAATAPVHSKGNRRGQDIPFYLFASCRNPAQSVRSIFWHLVNILYQFWGNQWTLPDKGLPFAKFVFSKNKKSMKSKNNEDLWKNIQVVKRDSEIPGKADYCLVSFIVSFILHLKASPFWSRSSHSLLSATATAVASLRLASSSWKGGEERWQTSVPSSGHKHMLPIAGHGLAPKSPLCKMQDRGEWTHTLHKTSESPMKSKIWVILL